MRAFGSHRGNPALRIVIEQTARRRLWASLGPERPGLVRADDAALHTRERFETLRAIVRDRFAPLDTLPEGTLSYFGVPGLQMWALHDAHALVLALDHEDPPAHIVVRARRWSDCLRTRTTPGLASTHWGHPVYGARLDPHCGEFDLVWAFAGEWLGGLLAATTRAWSRPDHWPAPTAAELAAVTT